MNNKFFNKNYILIVISAIFFYTVNFMLTTVSSPYIVSLENDKVIVGEIAFSFTFASFITRSLWGYYADKKSRRFTYMFGMSLCVISVAILIFRPNIKFTAISRIIFGVGYSAVTTAGATVVCDVSSDENIGRAIAFYGIANVVSQFIAPAFVMWLFNYGIKTVGIISTFGILISFITFSFIKYNENNFVNRSTKFKFYEKEAIPASSVILFFAMTVASIYSFVPILTEEKNIGKTGIFFSFSAIALLFARLTINKLREKVKATIIFYISSILFAIGFILIAISDNIFILCFAAIFYGISSGYIHPIINTAAVNNVVDEKRGVATSTFMMLQDLGMALGSVAWGIVSKNLSVEYVYYFDVIIVTIMVIFFKIFVRLNKNL